MNIFLAALSVVCLFHVSLAQDVDIADCLRKKDEAKQCVKTLMEEGYPEMQQRKAKMEEHRKQRAECFTKNGCEDPGARMEEFHQCVKTVFEGLVKPQIEQCTQFPLPSPDKERKHHGPPPFGRMGFGHNRHPHGPRGFGPDFCKPDGAERFEEFCTNGNATGVSECLDKVRKEGREAKRAERKERRGNNRPQDFRKKMDEMRLRMAKVRECMEDSIDEECQKGLRTVKQTVCDCAEELKSDENLSDNIDKAMEDCEDLMKNEADDEEEEEDKPPHLEKMVQMVCRGPRRGFRGPPPPPFGPGGPPRPGSGPPGRGFGDEERRGRRFRGRHRW